MRFRTPISSCSSFFPTPTTEESTGAPRRTPNEGNQGSGHRLWVTIFERPAYCSGYFLPPPVISKAPPINGDPMTTESLQAPPAPRTRLSTRRGALAIAFQEVFTVAIRVRTNRQMAADADTFRRHVKQLIAGADRTAKNTGYDSEDVKLAVYACIALLDESVLNSSQPMYASWPRQTLQEEVFGDHIAGENFFVHLQNLLARQDSEDLADLLEVFLLCLLLGFRGRYALAADGSPERIMSTIEQKIVRIRGGHGAMSNVWPLPTDEVMPSGRDPWLRRLGLFAGGSLMTAIILFIAYRFLLSGGISDLQTLASQLIR